MDICIVNNLECIKCNPCCGNRTNEIKITMDILKLTTDLMRAIDHDDKTYIESDIDQIIYKAMYFKKIFKI